MGETFDSVSTFYFQAVVGAFLAIHRFGGAQHLVYCTQSGLLTLY